MMTLPTEMLGAAGLAWGAHRALAALASVSSGAMTKQTTAAVINPKIKAKETKLRQQRSKFEKTEGHIAKTKILAPRDGLAVGDDSRVGTSLAVRPRRPGTKPKASAGLVAPRAPPPGRFAARQGFSRSSGRLSRSARHRVLCGRVSAGLLAVPRAPLRSAGVWPDRPE